MLVFAPDATVEHQVEIFGEHLPPAFVCTLNLLVSLSSPETSHVEMKRHYRSRPDYSWRIGQGCQVQDGVACVELRQA